MGQYQFSYDELCGLRNSLFTSWHDMVEYGVKLDTHPILVQLIINAIVKTIGYSEFWVKLPFVLFSLAAILYSYLFGLKWFGKTPALITASLFSFSYIFLFYAPLARMYSGGLFFSTALVYYLFNLCFEENKRTKDYVLFVLFILLCALNNHLSCLFALSCGVFGLFFQNKKTMLVYLGTCVAAVILYLPHIGITLAQLGQGGIGHSQDGWLAAPDKFAFFSLIKTLFGTGYVWIVFTLAGIISFIVNTNSVINKKSLLLFVLFLSNFFIIYFYSVYKAPIFQYSVMLFSAPCFIWAFASIIKIKKRAGMLFVTGISALLLIQSLFMKNFFENAVLNQAEFQANKYFEAENKYGKGNVQALYFGLQPYFIVLYEAKNNERINYKLDANTESIRNLLKNSKAKAVLLGDASAAQTELVKEYYPYLAEYKQCLNVNYSLYTKERTPQTLNSYENKLDSSDYFHPKNYEYSLDKNKLNAQATGLEYAVDSLNEFPFGAKSLLRNVAFKEGQIILAKIKLRSKEALNDVSLNYNITTKKDSTLFFGGLDIHSTIEDSSGFYVYTQIFMGSEFKQWIKDDCKITFFIWNRGKHKFIINDFQIITIDYWPARWSWWD